MLLTIPVSPQQKDVILYCVMMDQEIGMVPDERHWMVGQARKVHPTAKVLGADLNLESMEWDLSIEVK